MDPFGVATSGEARSHLAAAVAAIGIAPLLHGFFSIEEGDPDGIVSVLGTEQTSQLQHYSGGRATIIGADKIVFQQRVIMRAEKNYAGLFAGNFYQKVFHREAGDG